MRTFLTFLVLASATASPVRQSQEKASAAPNIAEEAQKELRKRVERARRFVPKSEIETVYVSRSHKISRQEFRALDGKGVWFEATIACTAKCEGAADCTVSGCDVEDRSCTPIQCTSEEPCTTKCTKLFKTP